VNLRDSLLQPGKSCESSSGQVSEKGLRLSF